MGKKAFTLIELGITLTIIASIMAAIWTGNVILTNSRLSFARSITVAAPIVRINGLKLWLETTSLDSFNKSDIYSSTGAITAWYDINPQTLSTDKINFTQSTSNRQPLYIRTAANGLPAIKFDGSNDNLASSSISFNSFTSSNQATVFLVQKYNSPLHDSGTVFWIDSGTNQRFSVHALWGSAQNIIWDLGSCCGGSARLTYIYSNTSLFVDKWNIITTYRDLKSSGKIRVNGVLLASASSGVMTSSLTTSATSPLYLAYDPYDSVYLNGYIAEVIIYGRALNDSEIGDIERYLSRKWRIPITVS